MIQINGFSPIWVLICFIYTYIFIYTTKTIWVTIIGFTPVYCLTCLGKLDLYLLIKSHASHLKDFSPTFSYMFSQIRFIFNNKIA